MLQVVLSDGRLATCTENQTIIETDGELEIHNGDLFWALRGGGGGTFGIVVHYVLKLLPGPTSTVYARFMVYYNNTDEVKEFLSANDEWQKKAPSYWGNYVNFRDLLRNTQVSLNDTYNVTFKHRMFTTLYKLGLWDDKIRFELQQFYNLKQRREQVYVDVKLANYSSFSQSLPSLSFHSPPTRDIRQSWSLHHKGKF